MKNQINILAIFFFPPLFISIFFTPTISHSSVQDYSIGAAVTAGQIPGADAYYIKGTVYLHTSDSDHLFPVQSVTSVNQDGGNIIVTDGCETTYIYPIGDNAAIISFLENL